MLNKIQIGSLNIHLYGLMMGIGFISAYILTDYRGKKKGLDTDVIFGILWGAVIGGMLGARLLYYIVELPSIIKNPSLLWDFGTGYVVYGGIIGGVIVNYMYCKIKKVHFMEYFDLVMPAVSLAQGFGRIGCFFAGCCYGRETELPFGIVFHNSEIAPNGVKLIPTQLISSAGDFLFAFILMAYAKRKPQDGKVAAMYLFLYSIGRFIIEFFRNDYRGSIGFLSTSQIISLLIFALGIVLYLLSAKGYFEKNKGEGNELKWGNKL
jgi:phosphatidylglycerol:prolipoprotein diacylglycerol transferase